MAECTIKSITLADGESFILPPDAILIGATDVGNLSSDCDDLQGLETAKCYNMIWSVNEDRDSSPNLEADEYTLYFMVGNVTYTILDSHSSGTMTWIADAGPFTAVVPDGILINPVASVSDTGARWTTTLSFQALPSVAATIKIKLVGPGFENGLFILPNEIDC